MGSAISYDEASVGAIWGAPVASWMIRTSPLRSSGQTDFTEIQKCEYRPTSTSSPG
jgi:hypothetical protein